MPNDKDSPKIVKTTSSTLKALQNELAESNELYEYHYNKLKEFLAEADQAKPSDQNKPKPLSITFKK